MTELVPSVRDLRCGIHGAIPRTERMPDPFDVFLSMPTVANGTVYVDSWDRNRYAIDATTGREKWRYTTGNDTLICNQIGIASSAAVASGMVFVGGRDGHVHAVDERTGRVVWTHDNKGGWTISSPAVRSGVVYFPSSRRPLWWTACSTSAARMASQRHPLIRATPGNG